MAEVGRSTFIPSLVDLLTTEAGERAYLGLGCANGEAADFRYTRRSDVREAAADASSQAEAALRRKAAELQAVMDALPAVVFLADGSDGRRIAVNRFAAQTLRLSTDQATQIELPDRDGAAPWRLFRDGVELEANEFPVQKAASGVEVRNMHFDVAFRDGSSVTLLGNAMPVCDRNGHCRGAVGVYLDVTCRHDAEKEVSRARDAAERANLAKTHFLAAASHDLRQPLQSLAAMITMLAVRERDPAKLQLIERADRTIANLGELLDAVLDVSQLDAGAIQPTICDFAIERLLSMVGEEFELAALEKALRLTIRGHDGWVRSDVTLLGRMIRNIVSNAVKYTPRGGSVELSCRERGGELEIAVTDDGIGIPPSQHAAIFEEFRQLMNPHHDRSKGLGLGLAIVSRMARLLGHKVSLRSRPGEGSTFTISVPLGVRPEAGASERAPARGGAAHGQWQKVLLVDDDELVADALRDMLEMFGFDVVAVNSSATAAAQIAAAETPFYAIVADYRLAAGSGLEAIETARGRFPDIQAVVLTGDTFDASLGGLESQGIKLLRKPVSMAVLGDALTGERGTTDS
jgi:signal transduction histidine kinase